MNRRFLLSTGSISRGVLICVTIAFISSMGCKNESSATNEDKIVLGTEDEAKAFVAEQLKKPIPPDYKIPAYITSGLPLSQVYDSLKVRYPDFYGKEHEEYLHAIMADPETYLKLNLESKAIRRYYDKNSKY